MPSYAARHFETFVKERNEKSIMTKLASRVREIIKASKTPPISTINLKDLRFASDEFKVASEVIALDKLAQTLTKEQVGISSFSKETLKAIFDKLTITQIGEIEKNNIAKLIKKISVGEITSISRDKRIAILKALGVTGTGTGTGATVNINPDKLAAFVDDFDATNIGQLSGAVLVAVVNTLEDSVFKSGGKWADKDLRIAILTRLVVAGTGAGATVNINPDKLAAFVYDFDATNIGAGTGQFSSDKFVVVVNKLIKTSVPAFWENKDLRIAILTKLSAADIDGIDPVKLAAFVHDFDATNIGQLSNAQLLVAVVKRLKINVFETGKWADKALLKKVLETLTDATGIAISKRTAILTTLGVTGAGAGAGATEIETIDQGRLAAFVDGFKAGNIGAGQLSGAVLLAVVNTLEDSVFKSGGKWADKNLRTAIFENLSDDQIKTIEPLKLKEFLKDIKPEKLVEKFDKFKKIFLFGDNLVSGKIVWPGKNDRLAIFRKMINSPSSFGVVKRHSLVLFFDGFTKTDIESFPGTYRRLYLRCLFLTNSFEDITNPIIEGTLKDVKPDNITAKNLSSDLLVAVLNKLGEDCLKSNGVFADVSVRRKIYNLFKSDTSKLNTDVWKELSKVK